MSKRSAHINVMVDAAEKAGRNLVRDFGEIENLQVSRKGPGDFVSNADLKAEKIVVETLQKARPGCGFILEEGKDIDPEEGKVRFLVDPLDGTTNFLHGIPHWAVSIGMEKDGEIVAGVVYDPIKDELFWAEKGLGAYLNKRRLRVSGRQNLGDALIALGGEKDSHFLSETDVFRNNVSGMRRYGSAALDLCYVAAGRFDLYWERGLSPWDAAAGSLIAKEAKAHVSELDGGKNYVFGRNIIAANPKIYAEASEKLKSVQKKEAVSA